MVIEPGRSPAEVATITSYSTIWIYTIARRYNTEGSEQVGDRRHHNPGQPALLSPELRAELEQALEGPAADGGLWTGPKVARWMCDKLGRKVHAPRGWELLQQLEYRSYVPRPRHAKANVEAQETFTKRSSPKPQLSSKPPIQMPRLICMGLSVRRVVKYSGCYSRR